MMIILCFLLHSPSAAFTCARNVLSCCWNFWCMAEHIVRFWLVLMQLGVWLFFLYRKNKKPTGLVVKVVTLFMRLFLRDICFGICLDRVLQKHMASYSPSAAFTLCLWSFHLLRCFGIWAMSPVD